MLHCSCLKYCKYIFDRKIFYIFYFVIFTLVQTSVYAQSQIARVEYYIDNDPGLGNATPLSITSDTNISNLNIPVNPTDLTAGVHRFYARAQDMNGKWSLTNSLLFYKPYPPTNAIPDLSDINLIEYYFDDDPGFGRATALNITPGIDLANLIIPINTERLSPCQQQLYVRSRDANGKWSLVNSYAFLNEYINQTAPPNDFMVQLDGLNDYIDLGTWFNKPQFTASFWVNPDSIQVPGAAIAALQNDLYLYDNPTPGVRDNYILSHLLQFDLLPNKWNHITITADSATQMRKVYLFGQLIDSNQWAYNPTVGFNLRFGNGGFFPAAYFKGQFDEIKLWDNVLTQDEIYSSIQKKFTGNETGLIGYWNFNNGCSAIAEDLTPNHRNGSLMNGTAKRLSTVPNIGQQIVPNKAGTGKVTVTIYDNLFKLNAKTKLTRSGFTDIYADTTVINKDGTIASCIFNLASRDTGLYNLVVINPDTTQKIYFNSFTIQLLDTASRIDIQMLGRNVFRSGSTYKFFIVYQNKGNVDVKPPPLQLNSYYNSVIAFSKENLIYQWQTLPIILGNRRLNQEFDHLPVIDSILSPGLTYTIPIYVRNDSDSQFERLNRINTASTPCEELNGLTLDGVNPNPRPDYDGNNNQGSVIPYYSNNGENYIDGCSLNGFVVSVIDAAVTSDLFLVTDWNTVFLQACITHDYDYQRCYKKNGLLGINWEAKAICDLLFYQNMKSICNTYTGNKNDCKAAALAYYTGIILFGDLAFVQNQNRCPDGTENPPGPYPPSNNLPDCSGQGDDNNGNNGGGGANGNNAGGGAGAGGNGTGGTGAGNGTGGNGSNRNSGATIPPNGFGFKPTPVNSYDPNEKTGPSKFQNLNADFNYIISFENKSTATAPAQIVTIIDTLDKTKFDLNSFSFGLFGFGDTIGQINYQKQKSFSQNIDLRPAKNMIVKIEGRIDTIAGIAYWKYFSLDPATMEITEDPLDGFLPPADSLSNRGEGFVTYSIKPISSLTSGTTIQNRATIIFDNNAPIITNNHLNIVDKIPPVSYVKPLRSTQPDSNFVVKWTGKDSISGIKKWDIYVSDNLTRYRYWKIQTSDTFAIYPGHPGHQYRFISIATDSANNVESYKDSAEAITFVSLSIADSICVGDNARIASDKTSTGNTYSWQVNTGIGYQNVVNGSVYSNATSDTLILIQPPTSYSEYKYRCIVTNNSIIDTSHVHELYFTNTWLGTFSSAWENPANWDCGSIPDSNTHVIINSVVPNYPVVNSNRSCKNLRINKGARIIVNPNFKLDVIGKNNYY